MNKMQMAHDWAMNTISAGYCNETKLMVKEAWAYADAMQAEADERNKAEAEQKRKEVREILNYANTFIEREGQHFDDVNECEVDWRLAPSWAKFWVIRNGGASLWCTIKPTLTEDCLLPNGPCGPAPSFGFTGSHIVERPQ